MTVGTGTGTGSRWASQGSSAASRRSCGSRSGNRGVRSTQRPRASSSRDTRLSQPPAKSSVTAPTLPDRHRGEGADAGGTTSVTGMDSQPMRARFPGFSARRGGYESFYVKAAAPDRSRAVWIRYTVHQRPHEPPRGSMWFTWFDAAAEAPLASKVTVSTPPLAEDDRVHIGEGVFGAGVVSGAAPSALLDVSWRLGYEALGVPL